MKFLSWLPVVSLSAVTFASGAFAQDPMDALKQSTQSLNDVPAYRMKIVSTNQATKQASTITMEKVNPDKMHMKMDGPMAMELISDGQKTFMSQGGAPMTEAPAQMAQMIVQANKMNSVDAITKMAKDVKAAGHDTVGGIPATIYIFSSDMMGMHATNKMWISDKDHHPLKTEGEAKGSAGGQTIDQQTIITFDYDPNIKITLPAS